MNDRLKFKVWNKEDKKFEDEDFYLDDEGNLCCDTWDDGLVGAGDNYTVVCCTGLKDKNGLHLLFEYDIIDSEGIKIGNYYENKDLLKTTTNYLIKRMGTKEWRNSEQEAIKRGCFYAE